MFKEYCEIFSDLKNNTFEFEYAKNNSPKQTLFSNYKGIHHICKILNISTIAKHDDYFSIYTDNDITVLYIINLENYITYIKNPINTFIELDVNYNIFSTDIKELQNKNFKKLDEDLEFYIKLKYF